MPRPKMRGFKAPPEAGREDGYVVVGALPEGHVPEDMHPPKPEMPGFQPPEGMEFVPEGMRREDIDWSVPFEPLPWRSRAEITLEFDSLLDVTRYVSEDESRAFRVGVPDETALRTYYGGDISVSSVDEAFGPPAEETDLLPDGKRDSRYLRKRMADRQSVYTVDLSELDLESASGGEALRPGDLILIGFFYRGSGQQLSGGGPWKIMPGQTYVANYLIPEGADAITGYWDRHILSDGELHVMIEENGKAVGGSIFEDSIELHTYGAPWGKGFETYIPQKMGYPIGDYLPILAGFATDNPEENRRLTQDFAAAIGKLYTENHVKRVSDWAKSFHYNFRAQAYSLGGLGVVEAALATDVTEGDNSTYDDALRQLQTAVNVKPDEKFLSMESNTFNKFGFSWQSLVKEVNYNASQGVNRVIFHGTAYPKTESGYMDWWPGWNWGEKAHANTFMAWDERNLWWENADRLTGYLSRLQSVLQEGTRKVDLAILPNLQGIYELGEGNSHQMLLDRGYSYNLLDENVLALPYAEVQDGTLFPEGPAYRALILADCDYLHASTVETVLRLAREGLPVVLEGRLPEQVFGVSRPGNLDRELMATLEKLKALPNVFTAEDDSELLAVLSQNGLAPAASYDAPGLECSRLTDGIANYYYFYNASSGEITADVTLTGAGVPAALNCWNGKLEPVAEYRAGQGAVTMPLSIASGNMAILAVLPDETSAQQPEPLSPLPEQVIDSFSLKLTSYGPPEETDPEYDPSNPTSYRKVRLDFDTVPNFSCWAKLPATERQLSALRVDSMADVSGVGVYKGTFTLPENAVTADLRLAHHPKDVPVKITVNGMDAGVPDCMTDILPLDGFVKSGENTIEITVASTLDNRCYAYDKRMAEAFPKEKDIMAKFRPPFPIDWSVRYPVGLYAATVVPYEKDRQK